MNVILKIHLSLNLKRKSDRQKIQILNQSCPLAYRNIFVIRTEYLVRSYWSVATKKNYSIHEPRSSMTACHLFTSSEKSAERFRTFLHKSEVSASNGDNTLSLPFSSPRKSKMTTALLSRKTGSINSLWTVALLKFFWVCAFLFHNTDSRFELDRCKRGNGVSSSVAMLWRKTCKAQTSFLRIQLGLIFTSGVKIEGRIFSKQFSCPGIPGTAGTREALWTSWRPILNLDIQ